jgi:hypothetical protein
VSTDVFGIRSVLHPIRLELTGAYDLDLVVLATDISGNKSVRLHVELNRQSLAVYPAASTGPLVRSYRDVPRIKTPNLENGPLC